MSQFKIHGLYLKVSNQKRVILVNDLGKVSNFRFRYLISSFNFLSCVVGNNNDPNFKNDHSEQVNTKQNINGTHNQWRFLEIQETKYYDNKIDNTCDDGTN